MTMYVVHVDATIASLQMITPKVRIAAAEWITGMVEEGAKIAKEKVQKDTGHTESEIVAIPASAALLIGQVRSNADISEYLESGTKAHWPPRGALVGWVGRHGSSNPVADEFLVRRAISRRGTKRYHYMLDVAEKIEEIAVATAEAYFDAVIIGS